MIELQGKFGKDCKIFANTIENEAIGTIQNILNNPVTTGVPVRVMPDTHQGVDIVIGFTMPVTDRVNPNHIGVDIGCGMLCVEIENAITKDSFPDINHAIRSTIPMGFEINQQSYPNKKGRICLPSYLSEWNSSALNSNWQNRLLVRNMYHNFVRRWE